jgi:Zn-finger nucleic acid-binding protein
MNKRCPVDEVALIINSHEGHIGYVCNSCKGVWVPLKFLSTIENLREFDEKLFIDKLKENKTTFSDRKCPDKCGVLTIVVKGNVEIDWCENCNGTWFDVNELKYILQEYPRSKEKTDIVVDSNDIHGISQMLDVLFTLLSN